MKTLLKVALLSSMVVSSMSLTGCATTVSEPKPLETKELVNKYKNLPTWVTTDSGYHQSTGSSVYRGQSFIEQKTEAETTAYSALVRRLETKVDVLIKNHFNVAGKGKSPYIEKFHSQTSQQLSSLVVSRSRIVDTYISPIDGELFVLIEVDEGAVDKITKNAESAFMELDRKSKDYNDNKDAKVLKETKTNK
jgi:hypothetical protein